MKIMYTSDIHIPYEDEECVNKLIKAIKEENPDNLILGGDIVDFYKISRFGKNPEAVSIDDERKDTIKFLKSVRKAAGNKCNIWWLEGNHEERLVKYIQNNAPEFHNLPEFQMEQFFELYHDKIDIMYIKDSDVLKIEDWVIRHGHEGNGYSSIPGNNARKGIATYGYNYIQGHVHKANVIRVSNYSGTYIGIESPCLCDINPKYVKGFAGWQQGWTVIDGQPGQWKIKQEVLN